MRFLVCVKQVPGTNKVEVDPVTGVLKRDGVSSKLNPYDLYGLELGLELAETYGGCVCTLTMGPLQAKEAIRETLSMGATEGIAISDRRFSGSDVLATSYTLAQGINRAGDFDLIICGKQTTDGDTAQVGPELAEHLNIPHVTNVLKVMELGNGSVRVQSLRDGLLVDQTIRMPCLICIRDGINTPRLPSYINRKQLDESRIHMMTLEDMGDKDENAYGLAGSPTQVVRMFPPRKREGKEMWRGIDTALADQILGLLQKRKMI